MATKPPTRKCLGPNMSQSTELFCLSSQTFFFPLMNPSDRSRSILDTTCGSSDGVTGKVMEIERKKTGNSTMNPWIHESILLQNEAFSVTCKIIWLVVWATPLKNMSSSIGMISNPIDGKIKLMFQSTNQLYNCPWPFFAWHVWHVSIFCRCKHPMAKKKNDKEILVL